MKDGSVLLCFCESFVFAAALASDVCFFLVVLVVSVVLVVLVVLTVFFSLFLAVFCFLFPAAAACLFSFRVLGVR